LASFAIVALAVVFYFLWSADRTPVLAFDKTHVNLGTVQRTQEGTQTFLVMNRGSDLLNVGPIEIEVEEGCDQIGIDTGSVSVGPDEMDRLALKFGRHTELGPHKVYVHVPSNDPDSPSSRLSMSFVVEEDLESGPKGPRLHVDKEFIHAGSIPYDWPLYEEFTLRNVGDAPLYLYGTPTVRTEEGC
jgi:hypothetical protein